jgi:hypothetical protein
MAVRSQSQITSATCSLFAQLLACIYNCSHCGSGPDRPVVLHLLHIEMHKVPRFGEASAAHLHSAALPGYNMFLARISTS